MRPHIQGLEKEYGFYPQDLLDKDVFKKMLFNFAPMFHVRKILSEQLDFNSYNVWLTNMARFYIDTGSHPEYATPECATALDVVVWRKAGDEIMMDIAEKLNKWLWKLILDNRRNKSDQFSDYIVKQYVEQQNLKNGAEIARVYRNSIDVASRQTYGEHENHIIKQEAVDFLWKKNLLHKLILLDLISRIIWQGTGLLFWNGVNWEYRLSQKEFVTGSDLISTQTTGIPTAGSNLLLKPLIGHREEPHADNEKWHRIHIVGGDANMAEIPSRLKFGITALLIQMFETKFPHKLDLDIPLEDLRGAYRVYAGDIKFKKTFRLFNREYSALDLQRILFERASKFAEAESDVSDDVRWTLAWWEKILNLIAAGDVNGELARITDVSAKYQLILSDMKKYGYNWKSLPDKKIVIEKKNGSRQIMDVASRMWFWELEYHRLSRAHGIFQLLPMERTVSEDAVIAAKNFPPKNTRAFLRRKICEQLNELGTIETIGWDFIKYYASTHKNDKWSLADPFAFA